jgi:hypothetical protein
MESGVMRWELDPDLALQTRMSLGWISSGCRDGRMPTAYRS